VRVPREMQVKAFIARAEEAERRLSAAEAKLAKVREWASRPTANNERTDCGTDILYILEEEP